MSGSVGQNAPPTSSEALAYAEKYAALGWSVFPVHSVCDGQCTCGNEGCERPGKHPKTKHGFKDATTDLERIRRWGDRWRSSNVAVATGPASGLVAIDIDNERAFEGLVERYGDLPDTVEQHTGRGRQLFFRCPDGETVRSTTALGGHPGVDVRASGGYVVVPPSQHISGKEYVWEASSDPTDGAQLAELPPAWLALLTEPAIPQTPTAGEDEAIVLREGQRNDGLFRLAISMRATSMSQKAIEAALLAENEARCHPPLPEREVRAIAKNAGQYEPGAGKDAPVCDTWPDPPDTCAYHGLAGEVVRIIEPHSEADPVALLAQFLVAFGSVIGRGPHFVAEADGHYSNVFAVLVGRTSKGRKGTAWGHVRNMFRAVDLDWADRRVLSGLSS